MGSEAGRNLKRAEVVSDAGGLWLSSDSGRWGGEKRGRVESTLGGLAAAGLGEGADAWAERGEVWLAGLRPHASFRGAGEGW